jgi:hypothetical protein
MKHWGNAVLGLLMLCAAAACKGKQKPDVSHLKSDVHVLRWDDAVFQLDTLRLPAGLARLQQQSSFANDYFQGILGLAPVPDSLVQGLRSFVQAYRPVYQQVRSAYPDLRAEKEALDEALRYSQHYLPQYKVPQRLIVYLGPLDGYGNVLTSSGFAVGLQLYMGPGFGPYRTDYFREFYPDYRSRRFARNYLVADCMRNLVNDAVPALPAGRSLLEQMVDAGKRLYVLGKLMPDLADTVKLGYTANQLKGAEDSEARLWSFFLQNNLLYATDPALVRDYVNDGPNTPVFGPESPGNIGSFVGWKMVEQWAAETGKGEDLNLLLNTPAAQVLKEGGYKPK